MDDCEQKDGLTDVPAEDESQLQAVGTGGPEAGHPPQASALGGMENNSIAPVGMVQCVFKESHRQWW